MAEEQNLEELIFAPVPNAEHRFQEEQQQMQDIHSFLSKLKWDIYTGRQPHDVTWLELFIIWEQSGYNKEQTRQGQEEQLAKGIREGDNAT